MSDNLYGPDSYFARLERLERKRLDGYAAVYRDRRERIATAALAGMLAKYGIDDTGAGVGEAVKYADALIAELDKEVQP